MSFSLGYVATIIFMKIHSSNEFISPHSTANNAINVRAYNYAVIKNEFLTDVLERLKIIVVLIYQQQLYSQSLCLL